MKKHLHLVGAAVAFAIGASGSALANQPTGFLPANTLNIAGSSAFEGAIEGELSRSGSSICTDGTFNVFKSNGPDFRAYTCTAKAGVLGAAAPATPIAIYYRGEGGSVTGINPVARNINQYRLDLSTCPTVATASLGSTVQILCNISGYNAVQDVTDVVAATGLEEAQVQLGFADEEPAMFVGENFPASDVYAWIGAPLNAAELLAVKNNTQTLVAQSFSVFVSNNVSATNLPKSVIAGLFRGEYPDWSLVPNGTGGFVSATPLPIKLCRREAGSGTQVSASLFFNDYLVSGQTFATPASPGLLATPVDFGDGGGVLINASSGAERTCLGNTTTDAAGATRTVGAIGFVSTEADGANYHNITIDGQGDVDQTKLSALVGQGNYDYWFEIVSLKRNGLTGTANTLANQLISVTQKVTTGPSSLNVTYLPGKTGQPGASYPLQTIGTGNAQPTWKQSLGCVTREGNSLTKSKWQCL